MARAEQLMQRDIPAHARPASPQEIRFTPQQLAYLEQVFPEIGVEGVSLSEAEVRQRLGQRSVIHHVRQRISA